MSVPLEGEEVEGWNVQVMSSVSTLVKVAIRKALATQVLIEGQDLDTKNGVNTHKPPSTKTKVRPILRPADALSPQTMGIGMQTIMMSAARLMTVTDT